ncbi:MAG: L,D-transpeptidase [Cyanothece sp. SIO1E1]|nr:L,D-transpeptidase [Cyanothece sp. SIO1E1]
MTIQKPLARCFMLMCFSSASLLILMQWLEISPAAGWSELMPALNAVEPRSPLPLAATAQRSKLVVSLSDRQVQLYKDNKQYATYPIAIGHADWQTPTGEFQVGQMRRHPIWQHPITEEIVEAGPDNPLGARWIGFWSDGANQIGFHGPFQRTVQNRGQF